MFLAVAQQARLWKGWQANREIRQKLWCRAPAATRNFGRKIVRATTLEQDVALSPATNPIENRPPHRSFTPQCTEPRVNFPRASREIQQRPVARRGCRSERGQVIEEGWRHMSLYEVQSFQNYAGDSKL